MAGKGAYPFQSVWLNSARGALPLYKTAQWGDNDPAESDAFNEWLFGATSLDGSVSESISFADAQTATAVFATQRDESIAFADSQTATAVFSTQRDESVALTDSQDATLVPGTNSQTDESVALTDSQTATAVFSTQRDESVAFTDAQTATAVFSTQRDESVAFTDSQDATVAPGSSQTDETVAFADAQSSTAVFSVSVGESVAFTDTQTGTTPTTAGKSHTNLYLRQILVEYYEQAFKREPERVPEVVKAEIKKPVPTKNPVTAAKIYERRTSERIARLVSEAEEALANKTVQEAAAEVAKALEFGPLITDFNNFERRRKERADRELLLFCLTL